MRLVGYVRVSQVKGREGDSFISPDVQRERIAAQARAGDHAVIEWIDDLDEPGSRYARPGFQRALGMVEAKEADGIVVARLDRFSRSVADAAKALERIEAAGGVLLAADLGMDTSTPSGKLMRNVLMALAEFELERIRDSWRDATARAIGRGVYVSAKVPVGYDRGEDGRLVREPRAAEAVRNAFLARAAGESWSAICDRLDASCPQVGAWTPQRLQWIVRNRAYLGESRQGSVVNSAAHEPLVSRIEFEAAQSNGKRREWRGEPRLLSGLVRCATCGYALRRDYSRPSFARYSCGVRKARGVCSHPITIGADRLDTFVSEAFLTRLADEPVVLEGTPIEDSLSDAVAALEQAEAELTAYRSTSLVTVLGVTAFTAGITERAEAVAHAGTRVAELRRGASLPTSADVLKDWETLAIGERRSVLAAALQAVLVGPAASRGSRRPVDERVSLVWIGDSLPCLPGLADRPE
jgi:site-specific DNA recombinase